MAKDQRSCEAARQSLAARVSSDLENRRAEMVRLQESFQAEVQSVWEQYCEAVQRAEAAAEVSPGLDGAGWDGVLPQSFGLSLFGPCVKC